MLTLTKRGLRLFAPIKPKKGRDGMPQKCYVEARRKPLNPYGRGPFCRLEPLELPTASGVYAVVIERQSVAYVGITVNLRRQWRQGYAYISEANCYDDGQPTNCKINNAILMETLENRAIDLWIRETDEPGHLKSELNRELHPPWKGRK